MENKILNYEFRSYLIIPVIIAVFSSSINKSTDLALSNNCLDNLFQLEGS